MPFIEKNSGVSLYFAILILSVLMASLLALISISVSQIKVVWTIGHSISAFYAADTGEEQALYRIRQQNNFDDIPETSLGETVYWVEIYASTSPECEADNYCIRSTGDYRKVKRKIETRY